MKPQENTRQLKKCQRQKIRQHKKCQRRKSRDGQGTEVRTRPRQRRQGKARHKTGDTMSKLVVASRQTLRRLRPTNRQRLPPDKGGDMRDKNRRILRFFCLCLVFLSHLTLLLLDNNPPPQYNNPFVLLH
jgi:hypothetical protein